MEARREVGAICRGRRFLDAKVAIDAARWRAGEMLLAAMVGLLKPRLWLRMGSTHLLCEVERLEPQVARASST